MPSPSPDIEQFAEALLRLGRAAGALERFEREVGPLADLLQRDEKLRTFLKDPSVSEAGKSKAIEDLLTGQVEPALVRFVQILVERRALASWPEVARRFLELAAESRQMSDGEILAAAPLADGKVKEIESEVGRILGQRVRLRVRLDDAMLGGVVVRVGDFVIDGSLDSRLDGMRRDLVKAG